MALVQKSFNKVSTLVLISFGAILVLSGTLSKNSIAEVNSLSPKQVVQTFCELDSEGQRTNSLGWVKIKSLVTWPDEPGWDNVILISNYKIIKIETFNNKSNVTVKYSILGSTDSITFEKSSRVELIKFELVKTNKEWKIDRPTIVPHVSKEFVIKHFRELQLREKKRKEQLESLIQEIIKSGK
jgi:hypothetical protein